MVQNGIINVAALRAETVWLDASRYNDAERLYHERIAASRSNPQGSSNPRAGNPTPSKSMGKETPVSSLVGEIAQARKKIQKILKSGELDSGLGQQLWNRVQTLETENTDLKQRLTSLEGSVGDMFQKLKLNSTLGASGQMKYFDLESDALKKCMHVADSAVNDSLKSVLEGKVSPAALKAFEDERKKAVSKIIKVLDEAMANCCQISGQGKEKTAGIAKNVNNGPTADDDDVDLFGSDEETEEEARVREERVKAYAAKKSKKPALVAKSSVLLDVKPWSDDTDMKALEVAVKKITLDGLVWGASKLVPLAYGIKKLQIVAIVEDDKVSIDELQEKIEEIEDLVQSVDIAAFNKL